MAHLHSPEQETLSIPPLSDEVMAHSERVGKMLSYFSRYIALENSAETLYRCGVLHDVGKSRIPPEILNAPRSLTEDERAVMDRHAEYGQPILMEMGFDEASPEVQTAMFHHEKWDGTGYPFGLEGEEIPVVARAAALCDVFDALLSPRAYKKELSLTSAISIIQEGKGTHFDPFLTEVFLDNVRGFAMVRNGLNLPEIKAEIPENRLDRNTSQNRRLEF